MFYRRVALALMLAGVCASCDEAGPDTLAEIQKDGYTYFGVVPFEAPLLHQVEGEFVGPEPMLAKRITQRIGEKIGRSDIEPFWIQRHYAGLIPALVNDEVDFVISVFGRTGARDKQVAFSDPYYVSELVVVINPVRNDKIRPNTLDHARIGVRANTAAQELVQGKFPEATIVPIDTVDEAILQLRSGDVDAVVGDRLIAGYSLATMTAVSHLEILPDFVVGSIPCAVAVRQGETELLKLINEAIAESEGEFQAWIDEQLSPESLQAVMSRHAERIHRLEMANKPRRVVIRISKSRDSEFDIYRVANLRYVFQEQESGKSYTTSAINFQGRTGVSSVTVPPGMYRVTLQKFNFTFGTLLIQPSDPGSVDVTIRLEASGKFAMRKGG